MFSLDAVAQLAASHVTVFSLYLSGFYGRPDTEGNYPKAPLMVLVAAQT